MKRSRTYRQSFSGVRYWNRESLRFAFESETTQSRLHVFAARMGEAARERERKAKKKKLYEEKLAQGAHEFFYRPRPPEALPKPLECSQRRFQTRRVLAWLRDNIFIIIILQISYFFHFFFFQIQTIRNSRDLSRWLVFAEPWNQEVTKCSSRVSHFFFFFNSLTPCLAVRRCGVIKRECHPRVATLSHSMIIQQDFLSGSILPRIMSSQ